MSDHHHKNHNNEHDGDDDDRESTSLLPTTPTPPPPSSSSPPPSPSHLYAAISILLIPTILLFTHETSTGSSDLRTLVLAYAFTGTLGMAAVMLVQGALAYATAYLCFGGNEQMTAYMTEGATTEAQLKDAEPKRLAERRRMARRWQYWVWMAVFAFVMAGLNEELLKYLVVVGAERFGTVIKPRDYVAVAVAASFGFATLENIAFLYAEWKHGDSASILALTLAERVVLSVAGHAMMAALTGVGVMARDFRHEPKSVWDILLLPVSFHGVFDFSLLAVSAYNGNVGWVHPRRGWSVPFTIVLVAVQVMALILTLTSHLKQYGLL